MEWQKETGNIDENTESEKTRDFCILLSRFVSLICLFFKRLFSRFVQVCLVRPDGKDREIIGAACWRHQGYSGE